MRNRYYSLRDIPPFFLWFALCFCSKGGGMSRFVWIGAVLILISMVLRVWARCYIGEHTRGRIIAAPELVTTGPYSISRNPLYVSNILFGIGLTLLVFKPMTGFFLIPGLFILHYYILIRIEEVFVRSLFGSKYVMWEINTPRIIGVPKELSLDGGYRSVWTSFVSDRWTWFFQGLMIVILVALSQ